MTNSNSKIFIVMADPKRYEGRPFAINWFLTEEEALDWIEKFGDKARFWFDIDEVESVAGSV